MKEATGELNMTVVTVVAIAAVAAFFYAFVWPAVKESIDSNTKCADAVCDPDSCKNENGTRRCTKCYASSDSAQSSSFACRYQDTSSKKS